jgi:hypothetical protein
MKGLQKENMTRLALTVAILLGGLALLPFIDIPAEAITWELMAGVYEPKLDVDEDSGAPGSIFAFTGSDYPPQSEASVYVNGRLVGRLMTDGSGMATFSLNTGGAEEGMYNVTMEVDVNAAATEEIELKSGEPVLSPPPGFSGPMFSLVLQNGIYLPAIVSN